MYVCMYVLKVWKDKLASDKCFDVTGNNSRSRLLTRRRVVTEYLADEVRHFGEFSVVAYLAAFLTKRN